MRRRFTMVALLFAFSAQLLYAQTTKTSNPRPTVCILPDMQVSAAICPPPDPTPTPTPPPPTPTPTPQSGAVGLKYVVLSVTYAPPGSASNATYNNSTMFGSTLSLSSSFTNTTKLTTALESGLSGIPGISLLSSSTISSSFAEEEDTSASIAVTETQAESVVVRGPSSSAVGVSHDEDIIWLWLNPAVTFTIPASGVIQWDSVAFDNRDPTNDLDIQPVAVKFLNGHAAMPPNVQAPLNRGWVCVGSNDPQCGSGLTHDPALTQADFNEILKSDPFADPTYQINVPQGTSCTVDKRYCLAVNHSFSFAPPPPGGQPITQTFTETRTAVETAGVGASVSLSEGITSQKFNVTLGFLADFLDTLQIENTLVLTQKINLLNSQQASQASSFSITGPTVADNYTGPVELDVFQDNVYGTFMFGAIAEPNFDVDVSPSAQNVAQTGCANYAITVVALAPGFSQAVNLSVSGLPGDATGVFTPATVSGGGTSTLQVCAFTSTPLGTSTLTIQGVSGSEVHTTAAGVTVTPAPNFSLSATPAAQAVVAGGTVSYTVTVAAQNGFSGIVGLSSCGGAPASVTPSFNPPSINVSGSSTLQIATLASTTPGTYTICIAGTSGALSHTVNVTLTVNPVAIGDFSLSATPHSQSVTAGDSAFYTVSSTALNGFTGTVQLSASVSSGDIFVDLSPASITGTGSAGLSVETDSATPAGTYLVSITGVSGSLTHTTSVTITVSSGGCLGRGICPVD